MATNIDLCHSERSEESFSRKDLIVGLLDERLKKKGQRVKDEVLIIRLFDYWRLTIVHC